MARESSAVRGSRTRTAQSSKKPTTKGGGIQRRRGRPALKWPKSKQRQLLRLYLCTPALKLPLASILLLLSDDNFHPKARRTQQELGELLSPEYSKLRPTTRWSVEARQQFLSSIKADSGSRRHGHREPPSAEAQAFTRAIGHCTTCQVYRSTANFDGDENDFENLSHHLEDSESTGHWKCFNSVFDPEAICNGKWRPSQPAPRIDRSWRRVLRLKSLKEKLPGERTSWLAEIASLISGNSHFSERSGSSSGSSTARRSSSESFRSRLSSLRSLSRSSQDEARNGSSQPRFNENNIKLIAWCCSGPNRLSDESRCVHKRLSDVIDQRRRDPNCRISFLLTSREANTTDDQGNALLHVAARLGAPLTVLHFILEHTKPENFANRDGETFLHVLDPAPITQLTPVSFASLANHLRRHRFDFSQVDKEQRTCLNRLLLKPIFPFEAFDTFLGQLSPRVAESLMKNRSAKGERLVHCICRKLHQRNLEIPTTFGDETDILARYGGKTWRRRHQSTPPALSPDSSGSEEARDEIRTPDANDPDTTHLASRLIWTEASFEAFVHDLLHDHFDPNKPEPATGWTPLMKLLRGLGNEEPIDAHMEALIRKMLAAGESVKSCDKAGNTALHYAAELGQAPVVRILCLYDAEVNGLNKLGYTPLQLAKCGIDRKDMLRGVRTYARYLECATILIDHGAVLMPIPPEGADPPDGCLNKGDGADAMRCHSGMCILAVEPTAVASPSKCCNCNGNVEA